MSFRSRTAIAAAFAAAALVVPVAHAAAAPPEGVTLEFVGAEGDGCPEGTYESALTPNKTVWTGSFSDYLVSQDTAPTMSCQVRLSVLGVPEGYTYAVRQMNFAGSGSLGQGESGTFRHRFSFVDTTPGEYATATLDQSANVFTSDLEGTEEVYDWVLEKAVADDELVWAPCDGIQRDLLVDTTLEVDGSATSYLTLDSMDVTRSVDLVADAYLVYKSC
jgi:hypothetical protein